MVRKFYQPYILRKISRESVFEYKGVYLRLPGGVFHPKYFFSTKFLLNYILRLDIKNKSLLELGAGSGLISISCSQHGAKVTSTDISKQAITGLRQNLKTNQVEIQIIESDLFTNIPQQPFDMIAINPPYYPKKAGNESEMSWYCGENFEYFYSLFKTIGNYLHEKSRILMVLSEDCNLNSIFSIAAEKNFSFEVKETRKFFGRKHYIFENKVIS